MNLPLKRTKAPQHDINFKHLLIHAPIAHLEFAKHRSSNQFVQGTIRRGYLLSCVHTSNSKCLWLNGLISKLKWSAYIIFKHRLSTTRYNCVYKLCCSIRLVGKLYTFNLVIWCIWEFKYPFFLSLYTKLYKQLLWSLEKLYTQRVRKKLKAWNKKNQLLLWKN